MIAQVRSLQEIIDSLETALLLIVIGIITINTMHILMTSRDSFIY